MNPLEPLDTTVRIWEYLYKVRIPTLQSRTIEDIRKYGVRMSGIAAIDRDTDKDMMTTMLSVAVMANYYKEGVPIRVCSQKDVKEIYDSISAHIHAWKSRLERGINIGDAPIDDLILLDKFANVIYEHAKYQFTEETVSSFLIQGLNVVQGIGAQNFFKHNPYSNLNMSSREPGVTRINAEDPTTLPERETLGEFFKGRLMSLRRY